MQVEAWRVPENRILLLGGVACAVALLGTAFAAEAALRAWLAAAFFWSGIPIGAVGLLMMMRLIPGAWSDELTVPMEAAVLLMPLAALAILPVLLGVAVLYGWSGQVQETVFRNMYLSEIFFVLRTVLTFAVLGLLSFLLLARRGWSTIVAPAGLIFYVPLASILGVDWLMSLDPAFHSSGFGLYTLSIQMSVAMAAAVAIAILSGSPLRRPGVLGALILSVLLAWTYFAFMPYFIIWSGDLPDGVLWYQRRAVGAWVPVLWAIAVLHAVPTLLLLFPAIRGSRQALLAIAAAVLIGKALESAWLVLPAEGKPAGWFAGVVLIVAMIGLGALFVVFLNRASRARVGYRSRLASGREAVS